MSDTLHTLHQGDILNSSDVRKTIYILALNQLDGKIDLANRAAKNFTSLYYAYKYARPIFGYTYMEEPKSDNRYIAPKYLMKESFSHDFYSRKFSKRVGYDIRKFKAALLNYRELVNEAYYNQTLNDTKIYLANVNFLFRGRLYHHSKSAFYAFTVDYPLQVLQKRIQTLQDTYDQFAIIVKNTEETLESILTKLTVLESTILKELDFALLLSEMYVNYRNVTKLRVALEITSPKIKEGIHAITVFFQNLRARGQKVYDEWKQLTQTTNDIWDIAINDKDMRIYFEYKNVTLFLQNFTELASNIERNFTQYRDAFDFRFLVGNADIAFTDRLESLITLMSEYVATSNVDNNFIRENFLQLDIFYRERSYEQITQQVAYDVFALLCDIGGSMGLFVGASVLTVFELFDLIAHQSIYRVTHAHK
ncbi:uncharacterized protein LOC121390337 [Gigantopelta aegis]|uniref:uncharacterized protein LOC121390337 n=1 Tax=Gigantopelta aegis TaxID=1735272 RepID=UPI001B88799B|nr:uncharacterized protein LOC121390337 [Gigantopelta aegis]